MMMSSQGVAYLEELHEDDSESDKSEPEQSQSADHFYDHRYLSMNRKWSEMFKPLCVCYVPILTEQHLSINLSQLGHR